MLAGISIIKRRRVWLALLVGSLSLLCVATTPTEAGKKKKKNMLARPVSVDSVPSAPMTLSRANEDWAEAHSQTRIPLPIKKGRDGQGWSKSDWLRAEGERHEMRVWVNDRNDLREIIPQDALLVGANLICERWFVQNPKKGKGVTIDFRFANYDGAIRFEFKAGIDELDEVERFLRFNVLTVSRRSDRLDAPATTSTTSTTAAPARTVMTEVPVPELMVHVVSAEARPDVVAPGDEIELLISYEVGNRDLDRFPVVERRTLLRDGQEITFFEDTLERGDGRFTSTQKIRIPADAKPGRYGFRARVGVDDLSDEDLTMFEVR